MAIADRKIAIGLISTLASGFALSRFLNYHPRAVQEEECRSNEGARTLCPGQSIKVVTYNAQFFAGINYHFFYDGGRDTLVDPGDVRETVTGISAFLSQENPDFVLLQEIDCGARRTGYSGIMLPILEDPLLTERWNQGHLSLDALLSYSAVCATGLDTIPLPGDISAEQLSLIIGDMASLAFKWHKPLSARLLPVLGKGWGEMTEFNDPFLVNAKLQSLDIK